VILNEISQTPLDAVLPVTREQLMEPNPREVSRRLLTRETFLPATTVNTLAGSWLQFMIHDWFTHGEGDTSRLVDIPLPPGDDWPQDPMRIPRIKADPTRPEGADGPITTVNDVTHWWDGSSLYGSSLEEQRQVRSGEGGKVRLTAEGKETGTYCALMGGTALPTAKAPGCPVPAAAAAPIVPPVVPPMVMPVVMPTPPEAPKVVAKAVEVIVSKCEERLRVGSDFLFDFDRAELRPEAGPALAELAQHIAAADKAVMIEGHTDAIGTESYNQTLSERRAVAVRIALAGRGLPAARLNVRGFGKSRPVAANQRPDGSDDPDGRQHNRRVEVVINTCS